MSARDGTGVAALVDALDAHRAGLLSGAGESLRERRRRGREAQALDALERRYGSFGLERLGGRAAVAERLAKGDAPAALGRAIEDALRPG